MKGVYRRKNSADASGGLELLKRIQSLPLAEKILISKKIIGIGLRKGNPAILFSGGKDSTVLLHLLLSIEPKILIIHNDTTLGHPDCLQFVRNFAGKYNYIETTADDPFEMWDKTGYYPILSKQGFTAYKKRIPSLRVSPVQCCYQLKEKYSNPVLLENKTQVLFWGNRAGESNRRKMSFISNGFLFSPKKYPWHQCYPLQHWTDEDINGYLCEYIPDYPFFTGRTDCLCCGVGIRHRQNNLTELFKNDRGYWERCMRCGFAKEILKIKGFTDVSQVDIEKVMREKPEYLNFIGGKYAK